MELTISPGKRFGKGSGNGIVFFVQPTKKTKKTNAHCPTGVEKIKFR